MTTDIIGTRTAWLGAAARSAGNFVCLAAAPVFAAMAFCAGINRGGPTDMLCSSAHSASPLSGMVWMYMLMSAAHSPPWLKLIAAGATPGGRARRSA